MFVNRQLYIRPKGIAKIVNFICLMEKSFGDWLKKCLDEREITQYQLSQRTGISPSHINRIISGERGVGEKSMLAIARALQIPPEEVYRRFGLLPPKPKDNIEDEELLFLYHQLSPNEKQEAKEYLKFKLDRKRAGDYKKPALRVLKEQ